MENAATVMTLQSTTAIEATKRATPVRRNSTIPSRVQTVVASAADSCAQEAFRRAAELAAEARQQAPNRFVVESKLLILISVHCELDSRV